MKPFSWHHWALIWQPAGWRGVQLCKGREWAGLRFAVTRECWVGSGTCKPSALPHYSPAEDLDVVRGQTYLCWVQLINSASTRFFGHQLRSTVVADKHGIDSQVELGKSLIFRFMAVLKSWKRNWVGVEPDDFFGGAKKSVLGLCSNRDLNLNLRWLF